MSFLDTLRTARNTSITAYDWFIREYARLPNGIYAFFEGEDDPSFYIGFIERFIPNSSLLRHYNCGSKNKVYETHERVMPRVGSECITLFFVDKDFSDLIPEKYPIEPNIYVTDYYSVENYLVSGEMLQRICTEIFRLKKDTELDYEEFQKKFEVELKRLYVFLLPFMAWVIHLRRDGQRPMLNNVDLSNIFFFNNELILEKKDEIKQIDEIGVWERMCNVNTPANCQSSIDLISKNLSALEPKIYIRGKFELWFFIKFIGKFEELVPEVKLGIPIGENSAVKLLGPRLQIPSSLEKFLRENISLDFTSSLGAINAI